VGGGSESRISQLARALLIASENEYLLPTISRAVYGNTLFSVVAAPLKKKPS